jgi:hypothetical protein
MKLSLGLKQINAATRLGLRLDPPALALAVELHEVPLGAEA